MLLLLEELDIRLIFADNTVGTEGRTPDGLTYMGDSFLALVWGGEKKGTFDFSAYSDPCNCDLYVTNMIFSSLNLCCKHRTLGWTS